MTSPGIQSINQFLYRTMPFDPEKAFAPISLVADMPMLVVVHPKVGVKTLKELIAIARANPGKLTFGSAGSRNHRPSRPGAARCMWPRSTSPMSRIAGRRRR